jgi:hypothetical protein
MQIGKKWLLAALILVALGGAGMVLESVSSRAIDAQEKGPGDHWRNYNGHWSYWHEGDKRWYYTDGNHWYYHNGTGWVMYEFDKLFGRTGFHLGDYKAPGREYKGPLPRHDVYRHP